jgi:hypothetical protein
MGKETTVGKVTGRLTHFLIEPFTPHDENEELYVAIRDERAGAQDQLVARHGAARDTRSIHASPRRATRPPVSGRRASSGWHSSVDWCRRRTW